MPGASGARNTGYLLSHGHHVWFFDDDDGVSSETIRQELN
jgi:glycosyltransferase involved in cell wall biosynthesis